MGGQLWYRRKTGGNWSTSGSWLTRISLTSFSLGFQRSGARASSMPGNLTRSATDLVPRACRAIQHLGHQVVGHQPVPAGEGGHERRRVGPVAQGQPGQLQPGRPALGALDQRRHLRLGQPQPHAPAQSAVAIPRR